MNLLLFHKYWWSRGGKQMDPLVPCGRQGSYQTSSSSWAPDPSPSLSPGPSLLTSERWTSKSDLHTRPPSTPGLTGTLWQAEYCISKMPGPRSSSHFRILGCVCVGVGGVLAYFPTIYQLGNPNLKTPNPECSRVQISLRAGFALKMVSWSLEFFGFWIFRVTGTSVSSNVGHFHVLGILCASGRFKTHRGLSSQQSPDSAPETQSSSLLAELYWCHLPPFCPSL